MCVAKGRLLVSFLLFRFERGLVQLSERLLLYYMGRTWPYFVRNKTLSP